MFLFCLLVSDIRCFNVSSYLLALGVSFELCLFFLDDSFGFLKGLLTASKLSYSFFEVTLIMIRVSGYLSIRTVRCTHLCLPQVFLPSSDLGVQVVLLPL